MVSSENINFDRAIISLLVDLTNMKKAHNLGLKVFHIVGVTEQRIYTFQEKYWIESGRTKVAPAEVIFTEFTYATEDIDYSIEYVVNYLLERYRKTVLTENVMEIAKLIGEDAKAAAYKMFSTGYSVSRDTEPRINKTNMQESVGERRARYEKRAAFDGEVRGAPLGFDAVDEHTYGILPGQLGIVAGYAKTGKSLLLAKAALAARQAGFNPLILSLEMATAEFEDRMDAIYSGVDLERLTKGKLDRDELKILHEAQDRLAQLGPMTIEKLPIGDRNVKFICTRTRELGCDLLIIDQLSHLEASRRTTGITEQIENIIPELTANISEYEDEMIPVLMAAQMNRESKKKGTEMHMRDIAGSSAIERYAHLIFGMERSQEMVNNNAMNLHILGGRNVQSKSWTLGWKFRGNTELKVIGENKSLL